MNKKVILSVVVPCYNEEKNIPLILEKFESVAARGDIEVVLVNNGSTDNSKRIIDELIPRYPFVQLVTILDNQGYGFGVVAGLKKANGEFLGYTHADMQTNPVDVLRALNILEKETSPSKCYIKGNRKKRAILDQFFTIGMSVFETLFLGKRLWDINAQPNIFHRSFFDLVKGKCPNDFSLDLYMLYMAKKARLNIIRFDVFFPDRVFGESSWNNGLASKWRFVRRTLEFSVGLKKEL